MYHLLQASTQDQLRFFTSVIQRLYKPDVPVSTPGQYTPHTSSLIVAYSHSSSPGLWQAQAREAGPPSQLEPADAWLPFHPNPAHGHSGLCCR